MDEAKLPHGSTFTAELTHTEWLGNEQYGYINFDPDPEVRDLLDSPGPRHGRRRAAARRSW